MSITVCQASAVTWLQRRKRAEDAGVADENVELAPALEKRRTELIDLVALAEIELSAGSPVPPRCTDLVVELFQRAVVRAEMTTWAPSAREQGDRPADAARGPGNEGDLAFEALSGRPCNTSSGKVWENVVRRWRDERIGQERQL